MTKEKFEDICFKLIRKIVDNSLVFTSLLEVLCSALVRIFIAFVFVFCGVILLTLLYFTICHILSEFGITIEVDHILSYSRNYPTTEIKYIASILVCHLMSLFSTLLFIPIFIIPVYAFVVNAIWIDRYYIIFFVYDLIIRSKINLSKTIIMKKSLLNNATHYDNEE